MAKSLVEHRRLAKNLEVDSVPWCMKPFPALIMKSNWLPAGGNKQGYYGSWLPYEIILQEYQTNKGRKFCPWLIRTKM